ncbi:MAG: hypothetical protein KIT58_15170 [Planctomycetota bacterium]|nr:hypothetical protein [Planctomycetota bacterium]
MCLVLEEFFRDAETCFPGVQGIKKASGMAASLIWERISEAVAAGWLEKLSKEEAKRLRRGRYAPTNAYRRRFPAALADKVPHEFRHLVEGQGASPVSGESLSGSRTPACPDPGPPPVRDPETNLPSSPTPSHEVSSAGAGRSSSSTTTEEEDRAFGSFWAAYPTDRRGAPASTRRLWSSMLTATGWTPADLLARVERYLRSGDPQFAHGVPKLLDPAHELLTDRALAERERKKAPPDDTNAMGFSQSAYEKRLAQRRAASPPPVSLDGPKPGDAAKHLAELLAKREAAKAAQASKPAAGPPAAGDWRVERRADLEREAMAMGLTTEELVRRVADREQSARARDKGGRVDWLVIALDDILPEGRAEATG